ncbi:3-phosphoshikimate 1-carboxyvinyltransferase [Flavobacterium sp. MAH-1]|uniref:3-phosphoshikimate 1-carboxyvinyltransferase n=1 Tax=Flavobacterium agri TaxID=2743471 RepID=A0A7Y9C8L8_9FLAO|nr:3-phosphoshikimate 1-carboxyvinyltransferase [Flavobacterium agri]NUY82595.1 3-phosphoshikimate 1-carboxyvinyltransferase [Flavobacterium agri]NYA72618.1 3-phosphoshikimate 1-carboxyvinyltransferase [Flavobacterium agri]
MRILLGKSKANPKSELQITGSKSETNRLLLLQALYPEISLANTSESDDSEAMRSALSSNSDVVDIHHAGTAMRFLTAYFAIQQGHTVILTGSSRMQERPIKILVDALRDLGADIEYVRNEGFPPLKIIGKKLSQNKVTLKADVSSQYISALLLIASKLENGLELTLDGKITSVPYINMTLALLKEIGIEVSFDGDLIVVAPSAVEEPKTLTVESDWSSASYFYSIVALSEIGTQITLSSYKENSLQGDSALSEIYKSFGVETKFDKNSVVLSKTSSVVDEILSFDLNHTPDIAQTIAVTAFALGIGCELTGLHTLKIKETDRLEALKIELMKLGADISVTDDSLSLKPSSAIKPNVAIDTYNDHRMAMAFAPIALKTSIVINEAEVVSKSFPTFWDDLRSIGFLVSQE